MVRMTDEPKVDHHLIQHSTEGEKVGEVRVHVKLTNPMDVAMVRERYKTTDQIREAEVDALVDTGAVQCAIPEALADQLGLARPLSHPVRYADGRREEVPVTEPVLMEILGRKVYEECLVLGDELLIGQTALESTDLFVDCRSRKVVPNPENPDKPVIKMY
jgi:clan AA aspartic protease